MTNILQAIKTHSTYGRAAWITKVTAAEIAEMVDVHGVKITFEITWNVGTKEQQTHTETALFEIVNEWSDRNPAREWLRLDEISDTSAEVYAWAEHFNAAMKKEAQA